MGMSLAFHIVFAIIGMAMPLGNYPIGVEKNTRSANRIVGYSESVTNGANVPKVECWRSRRVSRTCSTNQFSLLNGEMTG
jgi:hypothetical protein